MDITRKDTPFRYAFKKAFTECLHLPGVALLACLASSFFGKPKPWYVTALSCGCMLIVILLALVLAAVISGFIIRKQECGK